MTPQETYTQEKKAKTPMLRRILAKFRSKEPDQLVLLLRSIDSRLKTLESCVKHSNRHGPQKSHVITGHWND